MDANQRIQLTRKSMQKVRDRLLTEGDKKSADLISKVLADEECITTIAAIMAPKN